MACETVDTLSIMLTSRAFPSGMVVTSLLHSQSILWAIRKGYTKSREVHGVGWGGVGLSRVGWVGVGWGVWGGMECALKSCLAAG